MNALDGQWTEKRTLQLGDITHKSTGQPKSQLMITHLHVNREYAEVGYTD